MTGLLMVGAITVFVVFVALYLMVKKLLWVSTPNEALIFSGTTRQLGDGRSVGFRFVPVSYTHPTRPTSDLV